MFFNSYSQHHLFSHKTILFEENRFLELLNVKPTSAIVEIILASRHANYNELLNNKKIYFSCKQRNGNSEAATGRCSMKKVFLKILQNSQVCNSAKVTFSSKTAPLERSWIKFCCVRIYQMQLSVYSVNSWRLQIQPFSFLSISLKNRSAYEIEKCANSIKLTNTSCFRKPEVILQFSFISKIHDQWSATFMKRNSIVGIFIGIFRYFQNSYSLKHEWISTSTRCIASLNVVDTVIFRAINLCFQSLYQLLPLHDFLVTMQKYNDR